MAKTTEERIESKETQRKQLEIEIRKLKKSQSNKDRAIRAKRLIERGAILESLIEEAEMVNMGKRKKK